MQMKDTQLHTDWYELEKHRDEIEIIIRWNKGEQSRNLDIFQKDSEGRRKINA